MIRTLAFVFCLAPLPLAASQPISKSMAECQGLMAAMQESSRSLQLVAWLGDAQSAWRDLAIAEARSEGIASPRSYVQQHARARKVEWLAEGRGFVFSENYRDWTKYCGALGKSRGLALPDLPQR